MPNRAALADSLRLNAIAHQYTGLSNLLNAAADEIDRLNKGRLMESDDQHGDSRNLVLNIEATDEVVDKEEFMNCILDSILELCSCTGEEVDDAWVDRHTVGMITARWTNEPA